MDETDIFISGGGIAGLAAAACFGAAGFRVILADPAPPPQRDDDRSDLRSTAYLHPSRAILERAGVWSALDPHATPLRGLRVIDTMDRPPRIREDRTFCADELGNEAFGWNVPNWLARQALARRAAEMPGVELRLGTGFAALFAREAGAVVTLTDGSRIAARLAVAADGHASPLREAAGIGVDMRRYGQKALAFAVTHARPHEEVSTEIYAVGGAFTLVPLADHEGWPASAVVWMNDGPEALRLNALDDPAFGAAATERSCGVLGELAPIGSRRLWPVVTQTARALTASRVALVAEAAHVLPPIGAQGLNTSLADIAELVAQAAADPDRLGTQAMLDGYTRARGSDLYRRAGVIDLFNRVCRSDAAPVAALRLAGLRAVHGIAPIRRRVMQAGLGPDPA